MASTLNKFANRMGRGVKRTGKALGLPKAVNTTAKAITKDTLKHPVREAAFMAAGTGASKLASKVLARTGIAREVGATLGEASGLMKNGATEARLARAKLADLRKAQKNISASELSTKRYRDTLSGTAKALKSSAKNAAKIGATDLKKSAATGAKKYGNLASHQVEKLADARRNYYRVSDRAAQAYDELKGGELAQSIGRDVTAGVKPMVKQVARRNSDVAAVAGGAAAGGAAATANQSAQYPARPKMYKKKLK